MLILLSSYDLLEKVVIYDEYDRDEQANNTLETPLANGDLGLYTYN
jgi:hypothetical protein